MPSGSQRWCARESSVEFDDHFPVQHPLSNRGGRPIGRPSRVADYTGGYHTIKLFLQSISSNNNNT